MDVVKIKIGANEYDIKDAVVRAWMTGNDSSSFEQQVKNIVKYGIADTTGKTPAELEQLEQTQQSNLFTELDPVFTQSLASKLAATVDANGVLTLVNQ